MLNDVIRQSHPSPRTSQRSEDAIKAIVYHDYGPAAEQVRRNLPVPMVQTS
jgi:hypothetical protein